MIDKISISSSRIDMPKKTYKICDHIIGVLHNYDNTRLMTAEELNEEIKSEKLYFEHYKELGIIHRKLYDWNDYSDRRRNTNLTRFTYCPRCGTKIDWKTLCTHYTLLQ